MAATGDALIGSTGFVGSTLLRSRAFAARYHSSDIADICERSFDRIVCAGVTAVKWWANRNPEEDRRRIQSLIDHLRRVEAGYFVLISTIDVYGRALCQTEDDVPFLEGLGAYGRNRLELECFVRRRFPRHCILRLPGLFGPGLRKNAIYDLLHDNQLAAINPASCFQWYPLTRLADDLDRVDAAGLSTIHLATEPVDMATICGRFFPDASIGTEAGQAAAYDLRTRHDALFGCEGGYIMRASAVLAALDTFIAAERASA